MNVLRKEQIMLKCILFPSVKTTALIISECHKYYFSEVCMPLTQDKFKIYQYDFLEKKFVLNFHFQGPTAYTVQRCDDINAAPYSDY